MDTFFKILFSPLVVLLLAVRPTASEHIKGECYKFDVCRARYPFDGPSTGSTSIPSAGNYAIDWNATAVTAPRDMNNTRFLKSTCQCDEECGLYGDCCRDALAVYGRQLDEINNSQPTWSCQPLWKTTAKNDWKVSIYMVAQCPLRWPDSFDYDESLVTLCQRLSTTSNGYSHLMDIPVLSLSTNITYANVFCARCNGDSHQLARWNFTFKCDQNLPRLNVSLKDILDTVNYIPGSRKWVYRARTVNVTCELLIEQFKNVTLYSKNSNARRCIPNIGHCPLEWKYTNDSLQCSSYTSYVIDPVTNQVYRNPHCAVCHNVTENQTVHLCERFAPFSGIVTKGRFSFSGVFDFSFGFHVSSGEERVGMEKACSSNEIYDHLYNRCHSIVCGAMYINQEGVCIPKRWTNHEQNSSIESLLNSSCPRLNLKEGVHYSSLENGSIVLNKTGGILHRNEYEINQNETNSIQICLEESKNYYYYFKYSAFQRYLSDFCLSVSVVCLALHIAIHCAVPKLRNLPGKNLLSLSCALLLAQFLFLAVIDARDSVGSGVCAGVGVLSHWSYLSAFFWMNIMGVDVSRTFVGARILVRRNSNGRGQRSTHRLYSLYAWGCPTLVVSAGLIVDAARVSQHYGPNYGEHLCWICNKRGLAVFFVLPVAVLLVVNCILFVLTVFSIKRQRKAAKFAVQTNQTYRKTAVADGDCNQSAPIVQQRFDAKHQQQIRFVIYFKLALIMGLGWISGFVAALTDWQVLWYPFIVFNALQGAFIFATFSCKLKVYYMLYQWLMKRPHPLDRASSTTNPQTRTTKTSTASQPAVAASQLLDHDDQVTVVNSRAD